MTINDWYDPHNTVEDFQKEFTGMSSEELLAIAEKWKENNPGVAASLIISKRKRNKKLIIYGVGIEILIAVLVTGLILWMTNS